MQAVAHACQLVTLVAVEKLVPRVGTAPRHLRFQAVEVTLLRTETAVEEHPQTVDIMRHHRLEIGNQPVQFPLGHIHKLQGQRLGSQIHIPLLIHIPVKPRHIHLIVAPRLDKERLAVVLNLQRHHHRVIGIALQLESAVLPYHSVVHLHLRHRQHVRVAVQIHILPCPVHHLAVDGDIGLGDGCGSHCRQQSHNHIFQQTIHSAKDLYQ